MKSFLLVLLLSSVGCVHLTNTEEKRESVTAVVENSHIENFNAGGAAVGYMMGGKHRVGVGAVAGVATARGCRLTITVDQKKEVLKAPRALCATEKGGTISITRTTTLSIYSDGRRYSDVKYSVP